MNNSRVGIAVAFPVIAFLVATLMSGRPASAADPNEEKDLFDMSINELMDVSIGTPASITETNPLKTPASVTIITAEDIARTPARNILDLIEIYVPGAIYMNHSVGPLPGIRGVLADRPTKFLVNVNGVNVNIKAEYGARLELLNWDLSDISRIEVVRGPGSVTYGPGAIGGVINIYTKNARQAPGTEVGGSYWGKYNSFGNHIGYGQTSQEADVYGFLSVVNTNGTSPDLFGVDKNTSGYVGSPGGPSSPSPPFNYMADYDDEAQIKAHADVRLSDSWRLWTRYTTASTSLIQGNAVQYNLGSGYEDFRQTRYRSYQLVAENRLPVDNAFDIESVYRFGSTDVHNVEKYDKTLVNDRESLRNIGWMWSENEYFGRWMLHYDPDESRIKAAVGAELSYDTIGPAWGKNEDNGLRLSDGIISGPSSDAYGSGTRQVNESSSTYFAVGDGWETWSHAFLGELNVELLPKTTGLLSARLDKHSYTDYMFSPRAALIQELQEEHFLKFIAQRSVRMNTQEELYMNHVLHEDNDPEKLDSYEAIYSGRLTKQLTFQTSAFFNHNDVIAWDWAQKRTAPVGTLDTAGLEVEGEYKVDNWSFGANHAYTKQLDWSLDDNVSVSGISYSDYTQTTTDGITITSNGNDLNNWPNHVTKFFSNLGLLDNVVTLHADMRILWGFAGSRDGLNALSEAGGNAAEIDDVRRHHAYDPEISANFSLTYKVNQYASLMLFVQNIPILGDNKRYGYSSGFKYSYPDKVTWIEEPTVVGVSYKLTF
jgi:outer membrane cobalamin receptor